MPFEGNPQSQPRTKRSLPSTMFSSSKQPAARNDRYQDREQEWDPYPNDSPPRTPPAQSPQVLRYRNHDNGGYSRNTMAPAPSTRRETFLDDINAFDNTGTDDSSDDRDMHDLSLSPKHITRASVVDNMLLSFDQFSNTGPSLLDDPHLLHRATHAGEEDDEDSHREEYEDEHGDVYRRPDRYAINSRYSSTKLGRARGHTFSSSLSSDVDYQGEDNQGRYSAMSSRGRRSNSSSNQFQSGLRRIESVQDDPEPDPDFTTERGRVSDAQRAVHPSEKLQNSNYGRRVPKACRSAVTSGVDFPHPTSSGRRGPYSNGYNSRRSTSLDGAARQREQFNIPIPDYEDAYGTTTSGTESPHYGTTSYDMDAAPTPTVPVGPRRERSPTRRWHDHSGSHHAASSPNTPALSRKNSTKSSKSAYKKGRSDTLGTSTIRGRNNGDEDFIQFRDSLRETPPQMPASANPSAPSPTVSYQKPSLPPVESTPTPTKERPGFFRRVFGASKSSSPLQPERRPTQPQHHHNPTPPRENDPTLARQQGAPPATKPPTGEGSSSANNNTASRDNTPVVTKKPSSFFRRRKKSFVDHNPPPPLVLPQHTNLKPLDQFKSPEPSPVSSLRKIMNPYLANPNSSTAANQTDVPDPKQRQETGNEAAAQAWAESQDPTSMGMPSAPFMTEGNQHRNSSKYSLNLELPSRDHDGSFLADSSGNEGPSSRSSLKQPTDGRGGSRRPKTSPVAPNRAVQPSEESQDPLLNANVAVETEGAQPRISQSETRRPSVPNPSLTVPETDWDNKDNLSPRNKAAREGKGWLDAASSEEHLDDTSKMSLPIEGAGNASPRESTSDVSHYQTAENTPNIPSNAGPDWNKQALVEPNGNKENNDTEGQTGPSSVEREQAQKIFDNQDQPESDDTAAAWLGGPDREMVRKAYMELFDWSNMNILNAMRSLCSKIVLKGETQQVDRLLDSFSSRWCECNPRHGFKATDVVHTICYSVLLLNTDLHLADIESKMTRNQFIRNTMPTIHRVVTDAAPDAFETIRGGNPAKYQQSQTAESTPISTKSPTFPYLDPGQGRGSLENNIPNKRFSKALEKPGTVDSSGRRTPADGGPSPSEAGPLVTAPFNGTIRAWEVQVEVVLKEFYNSIQKQRLPLYGAPAESGEQQQQQNALLSLTGNMLRRTPSTLSKNGSDVYPRGRTSDNRLSTARFSSKPRSRARLYPNSNVGSSRTSLDDQSSLWSPAASSTWSRYSLGKTLTSVSVDSFGSEYPRGDYQQSVGFANALSQAIIREDPANPSPQEDSPSNTPLLEDESLQLAGAPWAKEGSLKHKHHLDSVDKRAKDRNWNECFAVIQQGWMRLFSFSASSRQKSKQRQNGGVVGGGNWMENAEEIWNFLLRQTIASALPPPGYSKSRPHVWALSLPTGAVHLFQVGTPEIVKEFVSTANYWSARLSKEPLFGGISNIEYGWGDSIINGALINSDNSAPSSAAPGARPSLQSSIRSSLDQQGVRPKLPADRVHITDWTPPQQSMMASNLPEAEQLKALQLYVKNVEDDLKKHNELRSAMSLAFSPRHPNSAKALANWERKSAYLLREIVKFRTYIDCLKAANAQKEKLYGSTAPTSENLSPFTEDEDALNRPRANSVSV
ncbi:hypothetical protein FQN54_004282 [Arachnomyces sp. PD_36]|nr:hypothetical protein FQN54_004282 [Arachnomyces sp. PD_36]